MLQKLIHKPLIAILLILLLGECVPSLKITKTENKQYTVSSVQAIANRVQKKEVADKTLQQLTEEITKQVEQNPIAIGFAIPVSIKETDDARQIIVKEESSGGSVSKD